MKKPKLTNWELILRYVDRYGKITPAKMCGRVMWGKMFGSETPRECRLLRERGVFSSIRDGKFVTFFYPKDVKKILKAFNELS